MEKIGSKIQKEDNKGKGAGRMFPTQLAEVLERETLKFLHVVPLPIPYLKRTKASAIF